MKVLIDIPDHEFDNDVKDKFQDYFNRVKADIADGTLCGNYELETTDMFLASFKRLQVLSDNATNGDMIKTMFPECCSNMGNYDNGIVVDFMGDLHSFDTEWWNALYKRGSEE